MANVLDIIILPTYDLNTVAVGDNSTYDGAITLPRIGINVPGFGLVSDIVFTPSTTNIFDSTDLGITTAGNEEALPDGIYCFTYTNDPPLTYVVEKSIMRVDQLLEKFDKVFMQLDLMECDRPLKMQSKVDLNTIWFFIQGSIASANNCAVVEATKLYNKADTMLDQMLSNQCICSGNNYQITFQQ